MRYPNWEGKELHRLFLVKQAMKGMKGIFKAATGSLWELPGGPPADNNLLKTT